LQADTLLLAVELVGGQLPTASGRALASAAEKLRAARHGAAPTIDSSDLLHPSDAILAAVNAGIVDRRPLQIEYWAEGTDKMSERVVEPYLLVHSRGEWYFVCWCRTAGGTRVFRVATTKSARPLDETFEPRPDVQLDLYRREGIPASGSYAPKSATVWYSPVVRRWIAERQPLRAAKDGGALAAQPYVDERWLTHHLLGFSGQARLLAPPEAVADLRATVRRILESYDR
jgi:predicted DNA-binding transcriptional regulator YafY